MTNIGLNLSVNAQDVLYICDIRCDIVYVVHAARLVQQTVRVQTNQHVRKKTHTSHVQRPLPRFDTENVYPESEPQNRDFVPPR